MSPTPLLAAGLALAALAALVVPPLLALAAIGALLGAALVDISFIRARPLIRRDCPEILSRGVEERFELSAEAGGGRRVLVRQALPPDLELSEPAGSAPLRGQIVARRRGRHPLPAAAARVRGPLGLATWDHSDPGLEPEEVLVYPDLPAAQRVALLARRSRYRDPGLRGKGPLGLGTEFESVREYSPDDDIRQVNWRATARLGRPMSNDYRLEQDRDVIALIDAGRLMAAPLGLATRLDVALDAMTALAVVADEVGDRFGAVAFGGEVFRDLAPRRRGGALCVRQLFDLEPTSEDSDYLRAFQRADGAKRAFVIVFTDLLEEVAARSLIESVPVLARRHALAIATVADPDLDAAVGTEPGSPLDVYRARVALDVLAARRRVAVHLRRAGAEVIEGDAANLGEACVNAYLRSKARARV